MLRILAAVALAGQLVASGRADVIIYGCTSAAMTAAVQTKRMGKTVLIVVQSAIWAG